MNSFQILDHCVWSWIAGTGISLYLTPSHPAIRDSCHINPGSSLMRIQVCPTIPRLRTFLNICISKNATFCSWNANSAVFLEFDVCGPGLWMLKGVWFRRLHIRQSRIETANESWISHCEYESVHVRVPGTKYCDLGFPEFQRIQDRAEKRNLCLDEVNLSRSRFHRFQRDFIVSVERRLSWLQRDNPVSKSSDIAFQKTEDYLGYKKIIQLEKHNQEFALTAFFDTRLSWI